MPGTYLTTAFDWLEFTVHKVELKYLITSVLRLNEEEFKALTTGRFGYNSQWKWSEGNVFVLFNSGKSERPIEDDKMGMHVIITGTGCRVYEQTRGIRELLVYVISKVPESKFTRIDLAIDDREDNLINFDRIHSAAINGLFTSRWNKWDELNSRSCTDNNFLGRTMYFGSQKSDIFVRIYDKKLERIANNGKESEKSASWTRLEVVYKKERAQLLAKHLVGHVDIGVVLRSTLKNYIRFIEKPAEKHDTNKARWPTAKWWDTLLGNVSGLKLTIMPLDRTVEQMADWLDKQIAPTLATIMTAYDGDLSWLYHTIYHGQLRMKHKHVDAVAQYRQ